MSKNTQFVSAKALLVIIAGFSLLVTTGAWSQDAPPAPVASPQPVVEDTPTQPAAQPTPAQPVEGTPTQQAAQPTPAPPVESTPAQPIPAASQTHWYIHINGAAAGPFLESQIQTKIQQGEIQPNTQLNQAGSNQWVEANTRFSGFPQPQATVNAPLYANPEQSPPLSNNRGYSRHVLGLHGGFGAANITTLEDNMYDSRLAGMFEIHYSHFSRRKIGIDIGWGLMGKGSRVSADELENETGVVATDDINIKFLSMELPISTIFNFSNFRMLVGVVPSVILKGKAKMGDVEEEWEESAWDHYLRGNLGVRFGLGGRIPLARQHHLLIAGLVQMDSLNRIKGDDTNIEWMVNAMITFGYEFGN